MATDESPGRTDDGRVVRDFKPFGLKNAAPEYQRAMNMTFDGMIGKGVFVHIDDIAIYAKTLEEHEELFN